MAADLLDVEDEDLVVPVERSGRVPAWSYVVASVVAVVIGAALLPAPREETRLHLVGWLLAGVVGGVCTGLFFRAAAIEAGDQTRHQPRYVSSLVVVIALMGLTVGAVNAWAVATQWAIVE